MGKGEAQKLESVQQSPLIVGRRCTQGRNGEYSNFDQRGLVLREGAFVEPAVQGGVRGEGDGWLAG